MNKTIIVMLLGSFGFILLGIYLLNNKYIKNSDSSNSEIKKEVKSIKLSGYTNILIGLVGIICSIVTLLCGGITKIIIAIFVLCIAILSIFQYIFNKKARI